MSFPEGAGLLHILGVALVFGLVNAAVKPLLKLATCSLYVVTLGLFGFVVNALMLQLTAWLAGSWLEVDGFVSAFLGALVISIVGTVLMWFLDPPDMPESDGVIEGR